MARVTPDLFPGHHHDIHSQEPISNAAVPTLLQRSRPTTSDTRPSQLLKSHSSNLTPTTQSSQGLIKTGVELRNKAPIQTRSNHPSPPLPQDSTDDIKVINSDLKDDAELPVEFRQRDFKVGQDGSLTYNPTFAGPAVIGEEPLARRGGQRMSTWQYIKQKYEKSVGRAWRKLFRRKREAEYEDFTRTVQVIFILNDLDVRRFGRALFDTGNQYNLISRPFAELFGIITESKPGKPILDLFGPHTVNSIQKVEGRFAAEEKNVSSKALWFDPMFYKAEFHISDETDRFDIIIGRDTILKYKFVEFRSLGFTGFRRKPSSLNSAELKELDRQHREARARNADLKKAHEEQKALEVKKASSKAQKSTSNAKPEPKPSEPIHPS